MIPFYPTARLKLFYKRPFWWVRVTMFYQNHRTENCLKGFSFNHSLVSRRYCMETPWHKVSPMCVQEESLEKVSLGKAHPLFTALPLSSTDSVVSISCVPALFRHQQGAAMYTHMNTSPTLSLRSLQFYWKKKWKILMSTGHSRMFIQFINIF